MTKLRQYPDCYYEASRRYDLSCPVLGEDISVDVCIIGGGYTGLSTALHLSEAGCKVAVLDSHHIASGASGRNGGHVGTGQRRHQEDLEKLYGTAIAAKLWQAGLDAVALVKTLIEQHHINCDLQKGILHVAHKPRYTADFRAEVDFLQQRYGYTQARAISRDEVSELLGTSVFYGGLHDTASMHLHPLNYALGLAQASKTAGAQLFEYSPVASYRSQGQDITVSTTNGSTVRAKHLVLACNGYLGNLEPRISGKIMPINNFLVATAPLGEGLANSLIRNRLAVQDSRFVINYWRCSEDGRLVFGGGESYRSSLPSNIAGIVRKRVLAIYPQLEDVPIDYAWGGKLAITLQRMPHVGRLQQNIHYAHGYSGHGVPTATFLGKAIAEAICSNSEQFELFAGLPARTFPGGTLLRWPGMVAGMLYYSLMDRF
ncbi:FAD-binding oxidoreductase [Porticoccus litoralis]|uniref:FAD-binding oxidoreductase n=1 Tax=Porticoccus litoralis TaxID=434086 RepID=A0AAW8B918_9GAMM|nr:FAD-binding oxidoreductase [Porticoccus litoralis]MDP1521300.1 FAD-binding oxidoreductase [Porticoccus litoralis]